MRHAMKKEVKEEDREKIGEIEGEVGISSAIPTSLMTVRCKCGNELTVEGKQPGWEVNFHTGVDFKCPCGEILSVTVKT